jgi:hypothetical protein
MVFMVLVPGRAWASVAFRGRVRNQVLRGDGRRAAWTLKVVGIGVDDLDETLGQLS